MSKIHKKPSSKLIVQISSSANIPPLQNNWQVLNKAFYWIFIEIHIHCPYIYQFVNTTTPTCVWTIIVFYGCKMNTILNVQKRQLLNLLWKLKTISFFINFALQGSTEGLFVCSEMYGRCSMEHNHPLLQL